MRTHSELHHVLVDSVAAPLALNVFQANDALAAGYTVLVSAPAHEGMSLEVS